LAIQGFSHLGLCVSNLARSQRFYCKGLGFSEALRLEFSGEPSATLLGLPGVRAVRIEHEDRVRIELFESERPLA